MQYMFILKGPDEFGHDGDAIGKMNNIEEIDQKVLWYTY